MNTSLTPPRRKTLQKLRTRVLTPVLILFILLVDPLLRLVLLLGSPAQIGVFCRATSHGLTRMMRICWGLKFELSPELTRLVRWPGGTVVVANHHSPLDIAVLMHLISVRPAHFICRSGLERGIPVVSPFVRYFGATLGNDPAANEAQLRGLGQRIAARGGVAVIFPEGRKTPTTYPQLRPFMTSGIERLLAESPSARIAAVAIEGTHVAWPGPWGQPCPGTTIKVTVADTFSLNDLSPVAAARRSERAIRRVLGQPLTPG